MDGHERAQHPELQQPDCEPVQHDGRGPHRGRRCRRWSSRLSGRRRATRDASRPAARLVGDVWRDHVLGRGETMMGRSMRQWALVAGLLMTLAPSAWAQSIFGTILGTVTDTSGAVLPGAQIRVVNVGTNLARQTTTDERGYYEVARLPPGEYRVEAEHSEFPPLVREGLALETRQVARVDLELTLGGVEAEVSVVGGAPLVESETGRISDVRSGEQLRTLPLNTISPYRALSLSPGVIGNTVGATTSFYGSLVRGARWEIDGVTMSDTTTGTQIGPLANNLENIRELKIDLANNSAESGAVGTVTMTTRSGTNELHGSLFEAYSTPAFRASNPFTFGKNSTITNQYGGSVGGPIWIPGAYNGRNRTFFYVTYMDVRDSARVGNLTPTVPLASWKQGDFSDLLELSTPVELRDPATGAPFAGNIIPTDRINPVAAQMQERFYPDPNFGDTNVFSAQNWRGQVRPSARNPGNRTVRVDQKLSDANTIFGRVVFQQDHSDGWLGGLPTMGQNVQVRDMSQVSVVDTHVFSSTVVNELRVGNARDLNDFSERAFPGLPLVEEFGIQGLAPDIPADAGGMPAVRFSGTGAVQALNTMIAPTLNNQRILDTTLEVSNQLTWVRGRQSLKFGVRFARARLERQVNNPRGLFGDWLFTNRYTGWPYADFLLGLPSQASRAFPNPPTRQQRNELELFVQDDVQLGSRLTVNLGLRYEYHPPWTEANGLVSNFDLNTASVVIPDGASDQISPLFSEVFPQVNVIEASEAGLPSHTLIRSDLNNFAPRVGLAFRPRGDARMVIRGAYGLFYGVTPVDMGAGGSPFKLDEPTFINPAEAPELVWPLGYPTSGVTPGAVAFPSFDARDPDFRDAYTHQWNVTLEQEIHNTAIRVSYVGTAGRALPVERNLNIPEANAIPYIDKPRPFPDFGAITVQENALAHTYNGLTTEVKRRLANGVSYQVSYTWSKQLGNNQDAPENPFDLGRERGQLLRFPNHRLTGNFMWELPVGHGRPFGSSWHDLVDAMLGGWQLAGVVSLQSGDHLTPVYSAPDIHTNTAFTTSSTPPVVTLRPDRIADGNLASDQQTIDQWFDLSAFKDPGCPDADPFCSGTARTSVGRYGTSGVGIIEGPGSAVVDLGLYKSFHVRDRVRLRFEWTATNVFNTPNYSNPNVILSNTENAGRITQVGGAAGARGLQDAGGPREMRLGLRLDW
ncbi:MAG: hypothetical protein GEU99_25105 [Luteitalea sp.]|nr:hypothetical protein [Luteitalea sp.]